MFFSNDAILCDESSREGLISELFTIAKTLLNRFKNEVCFFLSSWTKTLLCYLFIIITNSFHFAQNQLKLILPFMLAGYKCARGAATEASFSKMVEFIVQMCALLNNFVEGKDDICFRSMFLFSLCVLDTFTHNKIYATL